MNGKTFSVPRKAEWLLDVHYGDWHTVRKCSHAASGDCAEAAPPAAWQPLLPTQLDLDPTQPQGVQGLSFGGDAPSQEQLVGPAQGQPPQTEEPQAQAQAQAHPQPPARREQQAQQLEQQQPPHATAKEPRGGEPRPPQQLVGRGNAGKPAWAWQQPVPWMMPQAAGPSWFTYPFPHY